MVEFEDSFSERMAQLEQEDLERYQRDVLKNSSYSYDDETPNYVDEFQSKLSVLMDLVRGCINDFQRTPPLNENGSETPTKDLQPLSFVDDVASCNYSELESETTDEQLSDEELVANELSDFMEMQDFGDIKSNDPSHPDEMPKFAETVVSESGLQVLCINCAHMASKWNPVLNSQPVQGNDMSVDVYYDHFCNWKRKLEKVDYIGAEESYIDDFLYGLNRELAVRIWEYKWKPTSLYAAFRIAEMEEDMMKNDAPMVFDKNAEKVEENDCVILGEMDAQIDADMGFVEMSKPVLEEDLLGIGVTEAAHNLLYEKPVLSPFNLDENLYGSTWVCAPLLNFSKVSIQDVSYEDDIIEVIIAKSLSLSKLGSNPQVFDPGTFDILKPKVYETQLNEFDGHLHCSTWIELNEGYVVDGVVVFYVLDLQTTLGPLGDLTVNGSDNGSTKAWHDKAILPIKNVPRKYAIVDDAYKEFGEMTQAIRATLLDEEVMNHYAKYADFNKLILFDPGGNRKFVMSFSRVVARPLFGKAQGMVVWGFEGVTSTHKHANSFINTSHRKSLQTLVHDMDRGTAAMMILGALKFLEGQMVHMLVFTHPRDVVPVDLYIQKVPFKLAGRALLTLAFIEIIAYTLLDNNLSYENAVLQRITHKIFHLLEQLHVCLMNKIMVSIVTEVSQFSEMFGVAKYYSNVFDPVTKANAVKLTTNGIHMNLQCIGTVFVEILAHSVWCHPFNPGGNLLSQLEGNSLKTDAFSFVLVTIQRDVFFIFVRGTDQYALIDYILEDKDVFERVGKWTIARDHIAVLTITKPWFMNHGEDHIRLQQARDDSSMKVIHFSFGDIGGCVLIPVIFSICLEDELAIEMIMMNRVVGSIEMASLHYLGGAIDMGDGNVLATIYHSFEFYLAAIVKSRVLVIWKGFVWDPSIDLYGICKPCTAESLVAIGKYFDMEATTSTIFAFVTKVVGCGVASLELGGVHVTILCEKHSMQCYDLLMAVFFESDSPTYSQWLDIHGNYNIWIYGEEFLFQNGAHNIARSAPKTTAASVLPFSIIFGNSKSMLCALLLNHYAQVGWRFGIYICNESDAISKTFYGIPMFVFRPP